jgi:AGZA family xanthine/uracil permease-like MFS transporter
MPFPSAVVSLSFDTSTIGGGVQAVPEVFRLSLGPVVFTLFVTNLFDTMVTIIAVG